MVFYSDDPIADYDRYDRERQEWEDSLPHCEHCGEPGDDFVWEIEGEILCDDCAIAKYRRNLGDYVR